MNNLFICVICLPYTGTTTLARLLETDQNTVLLHRSGEANKFMNWNQRNEFMEGTSNKVVVDKSMDNKNHIDVFKRKYGSTIRFLGIIRNPIAIVASLLYRRLYAKGTNTFTGLSRVEAIEILISQGKEQLKNFGETLKNNNVDFIRYEDLADNPKQTIKKISKITGYGWNVDFNKPLKIKDYEPQLIKNQNPRQLAKLTESEKQMIKEGFKPIEQTINFLGYDLRRE